MFSVQTHSLNTQQLTYPMTLDSLYYDRYLFDMQGEESVSKRSMSSSRAVYAPEQFQPNSLKYSDDLAIAAIDNTMTTKAISTNDPKTNERYISIVH